jgi:flagellar hook-length control protein FliK
MLTSALPTLSATPASSAFSGAPTPAAEAAPDGFARLLDQASKIETPATPEAPAAPAGPAVPTTGEDDSGSAGAADPGIADHRNPPWHPGPSPATARPILPGQPTVRQAAVGNAKPLVATLDSLALAAGDGDGRIAGASTRAGDGAATTGATDGLLADPAAAGLTAANTAAPVPPVFDTTVLLAALNAGAAAAAAAGAASGDGTATALDANDVAVTAGGDASAAGRAAINPFSGGRIAGARTGPAARPGPGDASGFNGAASASPGRAGPAEPAPTTVGAPAAAVSARNSISPSAVRAPAHGQAQPVAQALAVAADAADQQAAKAMAAAPSTAGSLNTAAPLQPTAVASPAAAAPLDADAVAPMTGSVWSAKAVPATVAGLAVAALQTPATAQAAGALPLDADAVARVAAASAPGAALADLAPGSKPEAGAAARPAVPARSGVEATVDPAARALERLAAAAVTGTPATGETLPVSDSLRSAVAVPAAAGPRRETRVEATAPSRARSAIDQALESGSTPSLAFSGQPLSAEARTVTPAAGGAELQPTAVTHNASATAAAAAATWALLRDAGTGGPRGGVAEAGGGTAFAGNAISAADGTGMPLPGTLGWANASAAANAAPAAAATDGRLAASLGSADFAPQLAARITTFVRDGLQHARLELNPAEMGPLTVQIQLDGNAARVHLAAEHAGTRAALEQAMPQLAGSLRENGLTLSGGGVFDQPRQQQQAPAGNPGGGANDGGRNPGSNGNGAAAPARAADSAGAAGAAGLAAAAGRRHAGAVDLVA